jgi:hypothetical protein
MHGIGQHLRRFIPQRWRHSALRIKAPMLFRSIDEFGGRIDRCFEILEFGIDDGRLYAIECVAALHATNMPDGQRLRALYSVKK